MIKILIIYIYDYKKIETEEINLSQYFEGNQKLRFKEKNQPIISKNVLKNQVQTQMYI